MGGEVAGTPGTIQAQVVTAAAALRIGEEVARTPGTMAVIPLKKTGGGGGKAGENLAEKLGEKLEKLEQLEARAASLA